MTLSKFPPRGSTMDERAPNESPAGDSPLNPRKLTDSRELVVATNPKDALAERYRRLRVKLELPPEELARPPKVIMVTSAVPNEGKTTTAFNLALAFAEEAQRTAVLVDLDLRRPSVGGYLSPAPNLGISELLTEPVGLQKVLIGVAGTRLQVLPAGKARSNPTELLRSISLQRLIDELRGRFDWIVVDTPPVVPFSDAAVIQGLADGTLLIVRAGATPIATVERALEALEGGNLLGVVLNDVTTTPVDRYYYRYDDYDPYRYETDEREK